MWEAVSEWLVENWLALTALLVSLFVLYLEHLKGFSLSVTPGGRVGVTRNPFDLNEAALAVDLIFTNDGSKRGVVETVALDVTGPNVRGVFVPHVEFQSSTLSLGKELAPADLVAFRSFQLGKGESLAKRILFRDTSGGAATLPEGSYQARVLFVSSGEKNWHEGTTLTFVVESADVDVVRQLGYVPDANRGYFLNWQLQEKLVSEYEHRYEQLKERVLTQQGK